jgi:hypothetical protein
MPALFHEADADVRTLTPGPTLDDLCAATLRFLPAFLRSVFFACRFAAACTYTQGAMCVVACQPRDQVRRKAAAATSLLLPHT